MTRRKRIIAVLTVVVVIAALIYLFGDVRRIDLPDVPVDALSVRTTGDLEERAIADPSGARGVADFLRERRWGWGKSWHTHPTPGYTISVTANGQPAYYLWVGSKGTRWIGYRKHGRGSSDNLFRSVSPEERAELFRQAGIHE